MCTKAVFGNAKVLQEAGEDSSRWETATSLSQMWIEPVLGVHVVGRRSCSVGNLLHLQIIH